MQFVSWLTADTQESIATTCAPMHPNSYRPVFLLQPDDEEPIGSHAYEGQAFFGSYNAYIWLACNNLDEQLFANCTYEDLHLIGYALYHRMFYRDTQTNEELCIFYDFRHIFPHLTYYPQRFDRVIPELGGTGKALVKSGRLERLNYASNYPLKFSFDPDAVYEDLPASEPCPNAGSFYDYKFHRQRHQMTPPELVVPSYRP